MTLKLDTEGSELMVLHGSYRMLCEGRVTFIYTEFVGPFPHLGATGGALVPIAEYLMPFGYQYLTSYTQNISTDPVFALGNALFARKPN